ncbi:MAG: hypothetical protein JW874_15725 [Spirochaetales bacterium]|nr:hypothetical protein [Spirochaetales bacterium]
MRIIDLAKKIRRIKISKCNVYFTVDTIGINIFCDDLIKPKYRIVIEAFWRLLKMNKIHMSSYECPNYSNYDSNDEYEKDYFEWCSMIDYLNEMKIKKIKISNLGDLEIIWNDSTTLQCYTSFCKDYSWYFEDIDKSIIYEVLFKKVEI